MNNLTNEARIWLNIIYSRVSLFTHMTTVTDMQARMVASILSGISPNMKEIMISELSHFRNHEGTLFLFPCLITNICKREEIKEYTIDTWVYPGPQIFPLKF